MEIDIKTTANPTLKTIDYWGGRRFSTRQLMTERTEATFEGIERENTLHAKMR
jgi:hypothetical protein